MKRRQSLDCCSRKILNVGKGHIAISMVLEQKRELSFELLSECYLDLVIFNVLAQYIFLVDKSLVNF